MTRRGAALASAEAQVAAVRDDPAARLALIVRTYHGPTGRAPRHLPFRRAALSFMRWQAHRGVLDPLDASPPGSVWWRAVNERLLRDGCEAVALVGGLAGEPSSRPVRLWLEFIAKPTGRNWYRAHNASIVDAYLEHRDLAEAESAPERFFMNVALVRVLYAHALVGAPRLALGRFAPLGRVLGDPRLGMAGVFLSLRRVLPNRYPLALDVERYIADEQRLGRLLDYAVIVPRLQRIYEWSSVELGEPRLLELVRDGSPVYAWPFEERHVWRSPQMPRVGRVLERATRAAEPAGLTHAIGPSRPSAVDSWHAADPALPRRRARGHPRDRQRRRRGLSRGDPGRLLARAVHGVARARWRDRRRGRVLGLRGGRRADRRDGHPAGGRRRPDPPRVRPPRAAGRRHRPRAARPPARA